MTASEIDFWTDDTSVLFTSFWGWTPETWGTVGWSGDRGLTRRANLLAQLTDPFVTVCYVTSNKSYIDPALKGMIAGFMLVTHQTGDRDEFTHPIHHGRDPDKWRHSLRAIRAFSYRIYAELVNSDRFLPPSTISNAMRDAMLSRGLVTLERLRARLCVARSRSCPWPRARGSGGQQARPSARPSARRRWISLKG